jgi:hypothetical protein
LPGFETQYSNPAVIWLLASALDQQQLVTKLRMQDHLFPIRQLIVFSFLMNWRFSGKVYVNKNNRPFDKFILLLTGHRLLQQGQKNRYSVSVLEVGFGRSTRRLASLRLGLI